jgi:cytochrome c oxidase subunit 2
MSFPGLPRSLEQASVTAAPVDALFRFMFWLTVVISIGIAACIIYFAIHYRRRPGRPKGDPLTGSLTVELTWTIIPTIIMLFIFYWGARVYMELAASPADAIPIDVVGKQWMWKFQHPGGQTEIDELHVPLGKNVRLLLATEDVIHSFFVPDFRVKTDVVPGRYRTVWFRATKTGRYHLFCTEYCGTSHSKMQGSIVVMDPSEYQAWLSVGKTTGSLATEGEKLFQQLACYTCHRTDVQGRGPVLLGLFGKQVALRDGSTVLADESYLRRSILDPPAQIVAGFEPIMPSFRGLLTEQQVLLLIAYVKSLGGNPPAAGNAPERGAAFAPPAQVLPAP